jgi:hypothetical protein
MKDEKADSDVPQINAGYAAFQLAKALAAAGGHDDAATRERTWQKAVKWEGVISGLMNGNLRVGSRVPVDGVPGWVTLEVVTGGFATGNRLANGPLLDHERSLLARIEVPSGDERGKLNAYFLTEAGLHDLTERLESGHYEVNVPEEGALLVVAWLVQHGLAQDARILLESLGRFLKELRFYPVPTERSRDGGTRVHVQNVGETVRSLREIEPNLGILAQKETILKWTPFYDRMIGLFLETVEGEVPHLMRSPEGIRARPALHEQFPVKGGWPCRRYPADWTSRAQTLLLEIQQERVYHALSKRPEKRRGTFQELQGYLQRCADGPSALTGRDVGRIRLILAGYVDKRGRPDSPQCRASRERHVREVSVPTFHDIAQVIIQRLSVFPKDEGLENEGDVSGPVTREEAAATKVNEGTRVPSSIEAKVTRCASDTVNALVERGIIKSGEMVAKLLPQITSALCASAIRDPALRRLYSAIYRAFRRRRSLLLLNMESQIRIEELPWVAAMERFRQEDISTREQIRLALEEVTTLTLGAFPQVILPNRLVKELRALAKGAQLDLSLVDELAADIFMGRFGEQFVKAAHCAARMLEGTLYATYYGIDFRHIGQIPLTDGKFKVAKLMTWSRTTETDALATYCAELAGVSLGTWDPATNGMIIEQQQIVTTQNLAVLWEGLSLNSLMSNSLPDMARACFAWICRRQQVRTNRWHAKLIMVKNTAYGWRQMVFYLALMPQTRVVEFLAWANEHLRKQSQEYANRFRPALAGLELAVSGQTPGLEDAESRRFMGWTKKRHWLLDEEK